MKIVISNDARYDNGKELEIKIIIKPHACCIKPISDPPTPKLFLFDSSALDKTHGYSNACEKKPISEGITAIYSETSFNANDKIDSSPETKNIHLLILMMVLIS